MMRYFGDEGFAHRELPAVGVLLANLGTPDQPTANSLRPYLKQFLLDPRVIEMPRVLWWIILHLFVLTRRPARSAALYAKIWTPEGSPLLAITRRQAREVEQLLAREVGTPIHVAAGMRYGNPSIGAGLRELKQRGCRRLLVLPLYPQYFAGTTGSTFDAVAAELMGWRWVPALRMADSYHDEPGYIRALAASIREVWAREGEPEKLLFSFHGIPERYFLGGDPYFCHCHKSARLVSEELQLPRERYEVAFQSLFGREEWIKPYTDRTIAAMARAGVGSLDVICPGFAADCLETLEEIDGENREIFLAAGGRSFRYIPCLNDRPDHVRLLADLIERNLQGWTVPPGEWSRERAEAEVAASRQRADALAARAVPADAGYGAAGRPT